MKNMALCLFKCSNSCGCRECTIRQFAYYPRKQGYRFEEIQETTFSIDKVQSGNESFSANKSLQIKEKIDNLIDQRPNLPKIVSLPSYDQKTYGLILKEGDHQRPLNQKQKNEIESQNEKESNSQLKPPEKGQKNTNQEQIFEQDRDLNLICFKIQNRENTVICGYHIENLKFKSDVVVIHSHGNSTDIGYMIDQALEISFNLKVNVVAYDYTGYGCSGGKPSEKSQIYDLEAIYFYVRSIGYDPIDIILYGQSLGSGPSTFLASQKQYPIGGLIIHSGFTSGLRVSQKKEKTMEKTHKNDFFPNIDFIKKVNAPIFILHGDEDEQIQIHHANQLYDNTKKIYESSFLAIVERAGHNNIESDNLFRGQYFKELRYFFKFLDENKLNMKQNQINQQIAALKKVESLITLEKNNVSNLKKDSLNNIQQSQNVTEKRDYTDGFQGDGWGTSFNHMYLQLFSPEEDSQNFMKQFNLDNKQSNIFKNIKIIDNNNLNSSYSQSDHKHKRYHHQDQNDGLSVKFEQKYQSNLSQISKIAQIYSNESHRTTICKQQNEEEYYEEEYKVDRSSQDQLSEIERDQTGIFLRHADNQSQQSSIQSFSLKSNDQSYQNNESVSRDKNNRFKYQQEDKQKKIKLQSSKNKEEFSHNNTQNNQENDQFKKILFKNQNNTQSRLGEKYNKKDNFTQSNQIYNYQDSKNDLLNRSCIQLNHGENKQKISNSLSCCNDSPQTSKNKQININDKQSLDSQKKLSSSHRNQSFHLSSSSQEETTKKKKIIKEIKKCKKQNDFEDDDIRLFNVTKFGRSQKNSILSGFIIENKNQEKSSDSSSSSFLKPSQFNQQIKQKSNKGKETTQSMHVSKNQSKFARDNNNNNIFESNSISSQKQENQSHKCKINQDYIKSKEEKSSLKSNQINKILNSNDVETIVQEVAQMSKPEKEKKIKSQNKPSKSQQINNLKSFSNSTTMQNLSLIISKQKKSQILSEKSSTQQNLDIQQQMDKPQKESVNQQNSYDQPIQTNKEEKMNLKGNVTLPNSSSSLGPSISVRQSNMIQSNDKDSDNLDIQKKKQSQNNSSFQSKESMKSINSKI